MKSLIFVELIHVITHFSKRNPILLFQLWWKVNIFAMIAIDFNEFSSHDIGMLFFMAELFQTDSALFFS